jgi:hypothetical protein
MCGQDWVARYRIKGSDEQFWLCPECESLWRDGADPSRTTEAYLSVFLEARGHAPDTAAIEPVV